jgi:hypothetical protein
MADSKSTALHRIGFRYWVASAVVVTAACSTGVWSYLDQYDKPTQAASSSQPKPARLQFPLDDESIEGRLRKSTEYLASDELQGRGVRTRGIDLAADFIAKRFVECGLKTKLFNGTPFQTFHLSSRLGLGSTNELAFSGPDGKIHELILSEEFTPLSLSGSAAFDLPLAFVGYGITAPEYNYDDYADLDVTGKAVVMLRHEPQQSDPNSIFKGSENTDHVYFIRKITNAVEHGAAAVILCSDRFHIRSRSDEKSAGGGSAKVDGDPLLQFQVRAKISNRRIPVVHCQRAVIESFIRKALGIGLDELEKRIDAGLASQSCDLKGFKASGTVSVLPKGRVLKNIAALLEGSNLDTAETIVVGAHYDHIGLGGWGSLAIGVDDEIHNGADDNSSGTAVVLEVARQLVSRKEPLKRHVLFITFTAEEMGLVGSKRYVRNPLVPLKDTIAMLNLDMVGRLRSDNLTVYGTGTAREFDTLIDRLSLEKEFCVSKQASGYGPSDHASFHEHGVPVLHFFTGFHKDYHRPGDDFEKLNHAGMRRIASLVTDLVVKLAQAERRPEQMTSDDLATLFGTSGSSSGGAKGNPTRTYLGVSAATDYPDSGYLVRRVMAHGPAAKSGIQVGDVIIQFGEKKIKRPEHLGTAVRERKPADVVPILIRRGTLELEMQVTLGRAVR